MKAAHHSHAAHAQQSSSKTLVANETGNGSTNSTTTHAPHDPKQNKVKYNGDEDRLFVIPPLELRKSDREIRVLMSRYMQLKHSSAL